jgi:hypothetical protein
MNHHQEVSMSFVEMEFVARISNIFHGHATIFDPVPFDEPVLLRG